MAGAWLGVAVATVLIESGGLPAYVREDILDGAGESDSMVKVMENRAQGRNCVLKAFVGLVLMFAHWEGAKMSIVVLAVWLKHWRIWSQS